MRMVRDGGRTPPGRAARGGESGDRGGVEGAGGREGQVDGGVPSQEFREPLPESLIRDRPDGELVVGLAVGEDIAVSTGTSSRSRSRM